MFSSLTRHTQFAKQSIELHGQSASSHRLYVSDDGLCTIRALTIADRDIGARRSQCAGDRSTDPARTAGDKGDFVSEIYWQCSSSPRRGS